MVLPSASQRVLLPRMRMDSVQEEMMMVREMILMTTATHGSEAAAIEIAVASVMMMTTMSSLTMVEVGAEGAVIGSEGSVPDPTGGMRR